jgi:hypothetical protein
MKRQKKNKIIFILTNTLFNAGFCLVLGAWPKLAGAQAQIEIGFQNQPATLATDPAAYIQYFFTFGLGLVGFLAVAAIVIGGILYMTGSTVGKVDRAKTIIAGAITGVVLLLCSYLLFSIIDPTLLNLSPLTPGNPGTLTAPAAPQTQQQIQQQLQQQYAQPNTTQCNTPATCTEANCGPGAIGSPGQGHCALGERWFQTSPSIRCSNCSCCIP